MLLGKRNLLKDLAGVRVPVLERVHCGAHLGPRERPARTHSTPESGRSPRWPVSSIRLSMALDGWFYRGHNGTNRMLIAF